MKGLLVKDLYMSKTYCRVYLLIAAAFLALYAFSSVNGHENLFFLLYPTVLAGMVPINLIAYESQCKWEQFAGTLPYTRAQLVSAKYLIGLMFFGILLVMTLAVMGIAMAIVGRFSPALLWSQSVLMALCFFGSCTFILPLVFRFGIEKARIMYLVMIGLVCGLTAAIGVVSNGSAYAGGWQMPRAIPLVVLAAVVLYLLSWGLSIRFYQKREL